MWIPALTLCLIASLPSLTPAQDTGTRPASTRITDPAQHHYVEAGRYPFRRESELILAELDIRPGDRVLDIGAGDGWWAERMAAFIGEKGVVHAAEVDEKHVRGMKRRFADDPRMRPYLCPEDGTDMPEDSCDLVFMAQVYHHLADTGRVDYLRKLQSVVRPTGRLFIVEKHSGISTRSPDHGTHPDELIATAEEAGWVLLRYELLPGTYHYLAVFAQSEMFPAEPPRPRRR